MGLGCGGHSRLGLATGHSEEEAENVVRAALDLGINFIDTAETYRTEVVVGRGIRGVPRESIYLSTKAGVGWEERRSTPSELRSRVEACLSRLQTDYVDVFHVHGVMPHDYVYARDELAPALRDMREEGKIRFIGITEAFAPDPAHATLKLASADDDWDVVMVGFNIINQTARERVFPWTQAKNVGTLGMFAVRRALSNPDALKAVVADLVDKHLVDESLFDLSNPLGFLGDVTNAGYRFCRWEPGIRVVLSGTGNVEHLKQNARSLLDPPLPTDVFSRLAAMFKGVDTVAGN